MVNTDANLNLRESEGGSKRGSEGFEDLSTDLGTSKIQRMSDNTVSPDSIKEEKSRVDDLENAILEHTKFLNFVNQQLQNRYDADHSGPFIVSIVNLDNPVKGRSRFDMGKKLCEIYNSLVCDGYDLHNKGKGKFAFCFDKFRDANAFVDKFQESLELFTNENWNVFIPNYKIFKIMVLKGVPEDCSISEEEILENMRPHPLYRDNFVKPIKIERMKTYKYDIGMKKNVPVDTNLFKAQYKTFNLPNKIIVYLNEVTVSPYLDKVKQCKNCFRFGHLMRFCKDKRNYCAWCSVVVKVMLKPPAHIKMMKTTDLKCAVSIALEKTEKILILTKQTQKIVQLLNGNKKSKKLWLFIMYHITKQTILLSKLEGLYLPDPTKNIQI